MNNSFRVLRRLERPLFHHNLPGSPRDHVSTSFFTLKSRLTYHRQRTLEELDYTFGVPIYRHARYQLETWLPWFVRRYIFFQRSAKLEPLYRLEGL